MSGSVLGAEFPEDFDESDYVAGVFESSDQDSEFPGKAELEMSYSDWAAVGLHSSPASWLPAYGFQQPTSITEALLNQHDSYHDGGQQGYVYLETIMEETSDDLRSESDYSGWHDSDSGSVIHLPLANNVNNSEWCETEWSGSERDLAVPKKRRRRQEELLAHHEEGVSRSSSLVQFETLERHCDEHSLSFDSLERSGRWCPYSDSLDSSDDNLARSFSSSSYRSGGLRSARSFDSLVASLDRRAEPLSGEFSQSLEDTTAKTEECEVQAASHSIYQTVECLARVSAPPPPAKTKRSSENLSEDSGFGEHIPAPKAPDHWPKYSVPGWQSAPDLVTRAVEAALAPATHDEPHIPETKYVMDSKVPATSTPNLYTEAPPVKAESTVSLTRALSFKKQFETEGIFSNSKGSNLQMTTSFVSLGPPAEPPRHPDPGEGEPAPSVPSQPAPCPVPMDAAKPKHGRFGAFFQRFSLRRLSGKDKKRKEKKKECAEKPVTVSAPEEVLVRIVPLHGPEVAGKPPLPPRRREAPAPEPAPSVMSTPAGLLETDIDSQTTSCSPGKKARSLASLGAGRVVAPQPAPAQDTRAKSMEFLLDKENHQQAKPPENELQKGGCGGGGGERVMSEHELRVQRSLQRLNLPDWYRNCPALPAQGFLLGKRNSDAAAHWPGLGSKTTSLSSLGSTQSAAPTPRSPTTGHLLSPSPTPGGGFTRWSTSRLNSSSCGGSGSASTSPSGSARSSFNYRQPYLGWRSQERIARPRTPAERLAAGLLPLKQQQQTVPNLSEVHSSIKEVTSAIANYVSKADDRLSPAPHRHDLPSRCASPRGSKTQLCWLESSFVGSKPVDVPETPVSAVPPRAADLRLDLTPRPLPQPILNDAL